MKEEDSASDRRNRHGRLRRYLPLVLWMALIFFASTGEFSASNTGLLIQPLLRWLFPRISEERIAFAHFLVRKCGHFSEYAILGLLAVRAFITSAHSGMARHWFIAALLFVSVYAFSDEYHQSFIASRTASIYDSLIDIIGGLSALIVLALLLSRRRRKPKVDVVTR